MIVPGSTSQSLAASLAAETGRSLSTPSVERFADGEIRAAVPDFDADEAVVVAATTSHESWIELLQLQDAVREAGAERVTTVLPYMGYARQDRAFTAGEPVSARAVARAVSTGTDRVVVVTPHEASVADEYDVPATVVEAAGVLADPLSPDLTDPVFISPDEGAVEVAARTRDAYGRGETDFFHKERDYDTGEVRIEPCDAAVTGRDVVIVDDIVATGSTMSEAVAALADRDPGRIVTACVHPVLAGHARTKLAAAGVDRVVGTDTVERAVSTVSVAPLVADAL
jgi:ribose-phosphate pyrophosphokinase